MATKTKKSGRKKPRKNRSLKSPRPNGPPPNLQEAARFIETGDLGRAEVLLQKVVEADPDNDVALHILGLVLHQMGKYEKGLEFIERAIEKNPAQATYHYNKGTNLAEQRRLEEAEACFRKAIAINPDYAKAHDILGQIFLSRGEAEKSIECFQKAIAADSGFAETHKNLGNAYANHTGELEAGLASFRKALRIDPHLAEARLGLVGILKKSVSSPQYRPEFENDIKECFESPIVTDQMIAHPAAVQLKRKHQIDATLPSSDGQDRELAKRLASDNLFHLLLRRTYNLDPGLEIVLTRMRRVLLLAGPEEIPNSDSLKNLLLSFAHQCFNNEYVFSFDDEEELEVQTLMEAIEFQVKSGEGISPTLERNVLLFSMYAPLYKHPCARMLKNLPLDAWPLSLRELITITLFEPLEEEDIKSSIYSIGEVSNPISREIKMQYEENPYPRWMSHPSVEPQNFAPYIRRHFPHFSPPEFLKNPIRILNAGCGSGQSPIGSALTFQNAEFLGVDLSLSSLAYAKRMANKLGVKNIEFMQGDILNLSDLNQKFHVIESLGVLHHMENPEKGWSVLTDLLVPGGMMKLGFYSEIARRNVVKARKRIAERGLTPVDKDIRAFRFNMLTGSSDSDLSELFRAWDFFSLSECRDLLFHSQEHRYSVPQIKKMIEDQNLTFVGFQFSDPGVKIKYRKLFSNDANMMDLDCWERYESLNPDTFWGMYIFWCQKKLSS